MKYLSFLLIISFILISTNVSKSVDNHSTNTIDNSNKYLIIKVDDIGGNLSWWKWFYNVIQNDSRLKVDLGIIAKSLHAFPDHEQHLKDNILNNAQFGVFNHGWFHEIPEFDNRSYYYMYTHIIYWNYYMKTVLNYNANVNILGAPGNAIGNNSDCDLDLYTILAQLNYRILYFSSCQLPGKNSNAGGNLQFISFENNQYPLKLSDILHGFTLDKNYQFLFTQIHPTAHWNATYLQYVLNNVFTLTDRIGLRMEDYYTNFFLPSHPNYFLANPTKFLQTRKNVLTIPLTHSDYENALTQLNVVQSKQTQTIKGDSGVETVYFDPNLIFIAMSLYLIKKQARIKMKE